MRFITNIRVVARAAAQMCAATTRFTLWTALGAVALPGLQGADDPCSSATAAAAGHRAEIRAGDWCAPASVRRDAVAEARGSGTGGEAHAAETASLG